MSKTLLLMRHAKSIWNDPAVADFDRKLNKRGIKAAARMGTHMRDMGVVPEFTLCSSARRAKETWDLVQDSFDGSVEVKIMKRLYLASPTQILGAVRTVPDSVRYLLVLAHNPGIQELAHRLSSVPKDENARRLGEAVRTKFPTAALVILTMEIGSWTEIDLGGGHLEDFVRPRELT
ncbi:MAG: histidine phosphatase [Alphaproteobacteria bacterium]|nr:histidine phosphatase [Alphaproteobacteria bacterium]|tara:strand:+ start:172 stop:702 length:531 start_codon:yes stop_codon:yes gene_type:complete